MVKDDLDVYAKKLYQTAMTEEDRRSYERVRLDAGPAQQHSQALFAKTGYVEIPQYNANHIAVYFAEKRLA